MSNSEKLALEKYEQLATKTGMHVSDIVAIKNVSFPDLPFADFVVAMQVSKLYDLNPMVKEIFGFVSKGRVILIVSNAGLLKIARRQEDFLSITSNAVFAGDEFEMDVISNTVLKHVIHPEKTAKGESPLGAYAIIKLKSGETLFKWVYWNEYAQDHLNYDTPWKKQKSAMICKCATSVLCREAFGLSGVYSEEEFERESPKERIEKAKKHLEEVKEEVVTDEQLNLELLKEYAFSDTDTDLKEKIRLKLEEGITDEEVKTFLFLMKQENGN